MATNYKTLTSLTAGSQYQYRVTAIGDGSTYTDSDPSAIATFATLTPLDVPTGLTLTPSTNQIAANWTAVANATAYVLAYVTGNGNWTEIEVANNTYTLSGTAQGANYSFKVKAIAPNTAYEESAFSAVVSTTTLIQLATPAPTLTRTNDSITVSWAAIAHATGYKVSWKLSGGNYTEVDVATTSFTLDNLQEGQTYVFKVQAVTTDAAYVASEYSAEVSDSTKITLATPAPTLTKTTSTITATWTAIPNAEAYVVAYKTGTATFTETTTTSTSYTLDELQPGVTYVIKVKATTTDPDYLDSAFSSERSATTLIPLDTPTNVSADQITSNSARIGFDPVANATKYRIQYRIAGTQEWQEIEVTP